MGVQVRDFVGDAAVEVGEEPILAGRADQHILDAVVDDAPSYDLSVSDGSLGDGPSTVTIGTFTNVNDAPTISANSLSISEGGTLVLGSTNITTTDPDNTASQLTYTASSITGSPFQLAATGATITSFTQAQINSGAVRFVHDGGLAAPSYSLSVSDGTVSSTASTVTIGTFTPLTQGVRVINGTLYIIGTDGRDHVNLKFDENNDELKVDVTLNQGGGDNIKLTIENASSIRRIVAYLCDGDDHYLGGDLAISQFVFGGAGDDHIQGGRGNDVLVGGSGNDHIHGGDGMDILIGGTGKDKLHGGRGNDLLIGGSTQNQDYLASLDAALADWVNGDWALALVDLGAIIDDGDEDDLKGEEGLDMLFGGVGDKVKQ